MEWIPYLIPPALNTRCLNIPSLLIGLKENINQLLTFQMISIKLGMCWLGESFTNLTFLTLEWPSRMTYQPFKNLLKIYEIDENIANILIWLNLYFIATIFFLFLFLGKMKLWMWFPVMDKISSSPHVLLSSIVTSPLLCLWFHAWVIIVAHILFFHTQHSDNLLKTYCWSMFSDHGKNIFIANLESIQIIQNYCRFKGYPWAQERSNSNNFLWTIYWSIYYKINWSVMSSTERGRGT